MEAAKSGLERIKVAVERLDDIAQKKNNATITEAEKQVETELKALQDKFDASMADDFNTADAISAVFEMVKLVNVGITETSDYTLVEDAKKRIVLLMDVLGISVEPVKEMLDTEIEQLIEERQLARKNKDFQRADEIRDILLDKGIVLKDTREGVKWTRA